MRANSISLIVPAYRQEKTIIADIKNLDKALSKLPLKHELLVVVDGFLDKTMEKLSKVKTIEVKALGYKRNTGKGFAIKYGVSKAKGDVIGFIDAGGDIDPTQISLMLSIMDWNNADIVIGSKLHPESRVNYPLWRKIMSWGYRTFTHILFGFDVRDTQVGFKIFKKNVAKQVFKRIIVKKFAFDVEVLAVAQKLGYRRIYEAPVKINFKKALSVTALNFWIVSFWTFWDTLAVFYRLKILHYYDK